MKTENARTFATEIQINAPAEVVWKALTDAEELQRWFPLDAKVEAGEGGFIELRWGGAYEWTLHTIRWQENNNLRFVYNSNQDFTVNESSLNAPEAGEEEESDAEGHELTVEITLTEGAGQTTVRVVHSGFGSGSRWDEEFDAVSRGWPLEMRALRHYLENHRGKERVVIWARRMLDLPVDRAWRKLTAENGFLGKISIDQLNENDTYRTITTTGHEFRGIVCYKQAPTDFVATVQNLNNALFCLWFDRFGGNLVINLWLSAYGLPASQVQALEESWEDYVDMM